MHFREWNILYFDYNFTDVCSQGANWQSSSIGLDNGLAPNRWQAIIWTNADPINWRIYATLGGDELTQMFIVSACKSLSTVWAPKSFIHQETYEHKLLKM